MPVNKKPQKSSKSAKIPQVRKQPLSSAESAVETLDDPPSPSVIQAQQTLLNIFQTTFHSTLSSPGFGEELQKVKGALFDRKFDVAFGREDYLDVYAARWSPTRALCYAQILEGLREYLGDLTSHTGSTQADESSGKNVQNSFDAGSEDPNEEARPANVEEREESNVTDQEPAGEGTASSPPAGSASGFEEKRLNVLAIGGGAAEICALASFLSSGTPSSPSSGSITLLDTGPWGPVTTRLHASLTTPPPLSRYAGASLRSSNRPLIAPADLISVFVQQDVLAMGRAQLRRLLLRRHRRPATGEEGEAEAARDDDHDDEEDIDDDAGSHRPALLITLLFTLNELYNAPGGGGIAKTTSLLRNLTACVPAGSLLLVVDSPGSYSEAAVGGKEKKRYPMHWLLDHTLLGNGPRKAKPDSEDEAEARGCRWEKLESSDSVWFRVAGDLRYPIQLENMRYQLHLYRAVAGENKTSSTKSAS